MSFDTLAPHYRSLELLCAGNLLQICRTSFLSPVPEASNVLILGEGNGRFLTECRRALPAARITCVDASVRMLDLAKERLHNSGLNPQPITFVHASILEWTPPLATFDLIVTHFFLDCFRPHQLESIITALANAAQPRALWLLADFQIPARGLSRHRARLIHGLLYAFFRVFTGISACKLTSPEESLRSHRFKLVERKEIDWGLLHTDKWVRE